MPGENKEGQTSEQEEQKLSWWKRFKRGLKRGLKVVGGLAGQAASAALGIVAVFMAIGCIAGIIASGGAILPILLYSSGLALSGAAAYGCKKGFNYFGKMRKEGWTGQKQNSNQKNHNGHSQSRGQSNEQENSQQKDNLLVRSGKMITGFIGGIVSASIGVIAYGAEAIYNCFSKEKTNAVSSKCFEGVKKSASLMQEGWNGTKSLDPIEHYQSFAPERQMQESTSRHTLDERGKQQGVPQYPLYQPGGNDATNIRQTLTRSGNQQGSGNSLHPPVGKAQGTSPSR
jgi:hypothetical protein